MDTRTTISPANTMKTFDDFYMYVVDFFDEDAGKATLWFNTPNPTIGNMRPREMKQNGDEQKLIKAFMPAIQANEFEKEKEIKDG